MPTDRFRVGSVTKTFVAALTLSLAAEGKLGLSDPVARRLPGIFPYGSQITIRQLLNHTSGLYDFTHDPRVQSRVHAQVAAIHAGRSTRGTGLSPGAVVGIAASHPLDFSPGSDWAYSNTGYVVLGLIDEKVTGQSLAAALRARIFEPLRLQQSAFAPDGEIPGPHATGYLIEPGGGRMWRADTTPPGGWAASAIVSTTADLARFFSALLGGRLLPPHLMREMLATVSTHRNYNGGATTDGLGIFRYPEACGVAWGHSGGEPGFGVYVLSDRHARHLTVLAINGQNQATTQNLSAAAERLYCRSLG